VPADPHLEDVVDQRLRLVHRVVAQEALDGVDRVRVEHGLARLAVWALSMSPKASITSAPASAVARPVIMPSAPACRSHALASQLTALPWLRKP